MAMNSSDVVAGTNGTAGQYNNLRKDLVLGINNVGTETDGATVTIDLSSTTKGKIRELTLGGNRTLAISSPTASQAFVLVLTQDGTGSRTVTWWSGIKWVGATPPTLTTTPGRSDLFAFVYDGTSYFGSIVGLNFG